MPVPQLRDIGVVRLGYAGGVAARILGGYKALDARKNRMPEDEFDRRTRRHHRQSARRIYRGTLRLQGLMIKIGQTLGSRPDLLPQEYVQILSKLQDKVPAASLPPHEAAHRGAARLSRSKKRSLSSTRPLSPPRRSRRSTAPASTTAAKSPSRSSTRTSSASSAPTSGS